MKYKYSIIAGLSTMLIGFIPLSFKEKEEISYVIYANDIVQANDIKNQLVNFYKENCFSSEFNQIDKKLSENIDNFCYEATYTNNQVLVISDNKKIKMTGYLYKQTPSSIKFKTYFASSASSMPEATSIKVATSSLSDQI